MSACRNLALLVLTLIPTAARADRLEATLGQPLREVAHAVDVFVTGGVARYVVRRSFANAGKKHEEASLRIVLPYGAAATGLRIRSGKRWYKGELMRVEKARALYKELTGMGPHTPRDPALLQWVWANELHLQVFPVPPGATSTVEYTLTVPTRYVDGRYSLYYPRPEAQENLASVVVRVFADTPRARAQLDGRPIAVGQPVVLARPPVDKTRGRQRVVVAGRALERRGSHVVSRIDVPHRGSVEKASLRVDIRHTYRGDLKVRLVTPDKRWLVLHDRKGGSKNDLRLRVALPELRGIQARGSWYLVVSDLAPRDVGSLEHFALALDVAGAHHTLRASALPRPIKDMPSDSGGYQNHAQLTVTPAPIDTIATRLGRVVAARARVTAGAKNKGKPAASAKKQFFRLELDAAPHLRPLPRRLSVVFVVDASYSVDRDGLRGQLAVVRAFLSHVPDARFNIVLYRRRATALLPSFAPARAVDRELGMARGHGALALANGSALDAGIALARRLLARAPRGRPTMMVMLGDAQLRPSWNNQTALRELRRTPRALVTHVAISRPDGTVLERRDDKHALAPLAAVRAGVLLRLEGTAHGRVRRLRETVLGLVRPIRIDHFRVVGAPASLDDVPETFDEGAGLRKMLLVTRAPRHVLLRGKIWGRAFRRTIRVDNAFSRKTAAWVFSHDLHGSLSKAEQLRVAMLGRAVSPVTAYLAIEPGVRPSLAGIDRDGSGSLRGFGSGAGVGTGRGVVGYYGRPSLGTLLAADIARCRAQHKRPPSPGALVVDTTLDEIVDARIDASKSKAKRQHRQRHKPSAFERCALEAAWAFRLDGRFWRTRDAYRIAL
ncbi:MAG: proprotein convertase P-domain-containing protein [Myxococcales bacterium]|nr:proprotein convertase P-domain-containing protein [Myxococcales bacterium]